MSKEGKGLFEYQSAEELGIEASTPSRWVPVEYFAVNAYMAIKSGINIAEKTVEMASNVVEKIRGSVVISEGGSGTVYESNPASTD